MPDTSSGTIKPRTVKGFRDILPHQVVARRRMIDTIRAAFERYGFVPLDTPAVEYVDALREYHLAMADLEALTEGDAP